MSHYYYGHDEREDYDRGRRDGDWWSSSSRPPSDESKPYQDGYRDGHRANEERREEEQAEEARLERMAAARRADERAQMEQYEAEQYAQQQEQFPEPTVEDMCGPEHAPYPDSPIRRCYCGKVIWLTEVTA